MQPSLLLHLLLVSFCIPAWMTIPGLNASVPSEIETQFLGLRQVLQQADEAYFNQNRSLMSDDAYDALQNALADLIKRYPALNTLEAPAFPTDSRNRITHAKPVLSLKKVYTDAELAAFCESISTTNPAEKHFLIEPKIDGASIVIHYQNGRLVQAVTRGDSLSGVEVTPVILASGALPLELKNAPARLALRGEAYIDKNHFNSLNHEQETQGKQPYRHARNLASGTLMLEDFAEVLKRGLQIRFFECLNARELGYSNDTEALQFLQQLGLPVVEFGRCESSNEVILYLQQHNPLRKDFDFETDGWVVKVDDLQLRQDLGATQKYPRWAMARKYRSVPVITTVIEIEHSISENGTITPVAILEPVEIGGATVRRASLHSEKFMTSLGIHPGSRVKVIRAGGVTPEIVGLAE